MSVEKRAAVLKTLGTFIKSRKDLVRKAVAEATPQHIMAGKDAGFGLHRWGLDFFANHDAFGAKTMQRGLKRLQRGVSKIDTGLGAIARGTADTDSLRYRIFTDKSNIPVRIADPKNPGNYIPDLMQERQRASISAPIKSLSGPVVMGLAFSKWNDISEKLNGNKSGGGAQQ